MSEPASKRPRSSALFEQGRRVVPGGVNSPVRAFRSVGGNPVFFAKGHGAYLEDVDGNRYVDCIGSWGPLILGHAHPEVVEAVCDAARGSTSFGACTEREVQFATKLTEALPSIQKVRLVSSGTEATMSAIRLARGFTGRDRIVKIDGGYHGHVDSLLVAAGSGVATLGIPDSVGVTKGTAADTIVVPFNDEAAMRAAFEANGKTIAAIIIEPMAGNMGCVAAKPGYLEALRKITNEHGALLVFDEVITGFRLGYGGAQGRFGVTPDLTCLGKVVGGGLPIGAFGGRAEIMDKLAPEGPVYQAGTLSGNPVAVAAGLKTLEILRRPGTYESLEEKTAKLTAELAAHAKAAGVPLTLNRVGSVFTCFFTDGEVVDYATAKRSDTKRFAKFFTAMLDHGVYFPPGQFECAFVSTAHDDAALSRISSAFAAALKAL